ncbi:MAG: serine/threonine protein kinase [Cyanobacteria bacterium SZAS LIN-3]|nr:serine/threonine protein kinase [Cyanobacteria bacterium SZAS LIN-3]MBS2009861.1 serine/threonine protein kinase [Cyanobacteria bacterium SZAS TMP-1]
MADFDLSIRYENQPQKIGFGASLALLPLWCMVFPSALGMTLFFVTTADGMNTPLYVVAPVILGLTFLILAGFFNSAIMENDRLNVTADGIAFPPFYLTCLNFKTNRPWKSLRRATLASNPSGSDRLLLTYEDSAVVSLNIDSIKKEELEKLLLAIELWGKDCERGAELIAFQNQLQNETKGIAGHSYTQIWEEELGRRFHATSFVPLEPDHALRGGQLKVVRQLAFGGFSAIYLAQKDGNDLVVLKEAVVPPSSNEEAKQAAQQYLAKEAQILAGLNHPQIARVLDVFVEDDRHYLILEYVHGQDLRQLVKQHGAQQQEKVLDWALDLARILHFLHSQENAVIHRDLTPDNIVLRNDGTIVLIDFGAANEFIGTATGTLIGKQAFIAPEQLRGKAIPQSDFYALSGTLYYLLTGQDPVPLSISRPSSKDISIDPRFDELVAALSAFEAEERPRDAAEIVAILEAIKKDAPTAAALSAGAH